MKIINLTSEYVIHILQKDDLPAYKRTYPALFHHYFEYWSDRDHFTPILNATETQAKADLVRNGLEHAGHKLAVFGLDVTDLRVVLFVGQKTSNGHAFKDGDRFVVWIPVETYRTHLDAEVFVTHEIIHALHYAGCPEFYFSNLTEKRRVSRQLITEGLSTYLSMTTLAIDEGAALWGDYLSPEAVKDWLCRCRNGETELKKYLLEIFSSSSPKIGLFYAKDPRDIFQYRAGYYIGLKFIKHAVQTKGLAAQHLLHMPRDEFESLAVKYLSDQNSNII
jgi:uncharacterized protein YjaZ